jgi:hypothetical protein
MAEMMKTKRVSAAREKHLDPKRRGKALRHPPKPPPVEGQSAQFREVTCPEGHPNWVEYDPNQYNYYECPVCHCHFEL